MKRFRLSTLMFLVIIAAMGMALVIQGKRAARREADLNAKIHKLESVELWLEFHGLRAAALNQFPRAAEKRLAIEPMEVSERGKR